MYLTIDRILRVIACFCAALGVSITAWTQSLSSASAPAVAQVTALSPAPSSGPATPVNWRFAGVDWSAYLDGYGSLNNNHPNDGLNDLYNFNDRTDQFDLAEARITLNRGPNPVGIHADVVFGRVNAILHPDTTKYDDNYLEQAYVSYTPRKSHGSEFDLGQFVTYAGVEVIEAKDDWNYSRSLLFSWATPYYHFGLRSTTPVNKFWTVGAQLVNGWNNTVNNQGGPTGSINSTVTRPRYTWSADVYTGPERSNGLNMYRNLLDTTLLLTPTAKFNAYINLDYDHNHTDATANLPESNANWGGVALAAHEQITSQQAFAGRVEQLDDKEGFSTGLAQTVREVTMTYEHKAFKSRFLGRLEYRHDWSNKQFFHKGVSSLVDAQSTLSIGMMAIVSP